MAYELDNFILIILINSNNSIYKKSQKRSILMIFEDRVKIRVY